jgi:DNA-binding NarL/FixJ family response regulator
MKHPSAQCVDIKVVIADDHAMVREGLRRIIEVEPGLTVVGQAVDGVSTLEVLRRTPCDLLLLDLTMPGRSGADLISDVRQSFPDVPLLVVSMHDSPLLVRSAVRAGANGYVTKDSDPELLVDAMRCVAMGRSWISPSLAGMMILDSQKIPAHERLSAREMQIMRLLVQGKSNGLIARELFLSDKTVSTHKSNVLEKMGLRSTADLVRYCSEHNIES